MSHTWNWIYSTLSKIVNMSYRILAQYLLDKNLKNILSIEMILILHKWRIESCMIYNRLKIYQRKKILRNFLCTFQSLKLEYSLKVNMNYSQRYSPNNFRINMCIFHKFPNFLHNQDYNSDKIYCRMAEYKINKIRRKANIPRCQHYKLFLQSKLAYMQLYQMQYSSPLQMKISDIVLGRLGKTSSQNMQDCIRLLDNL